MAIGRESLARAQLVHDHKADTIGKRPLLVGIFAKECNGSLESVGSDNLKLK